MSSSIWTLCRTWMSPFPKTRAHVHLDGGETEVLLELPSGEHSLQLLLGDEEHEPHAPPLISKKSQDHRQMIHAYPVDP